MTNPVRVSSVLAMAFVYGLVAAPPAASAQEHLRVDVWLNESGPGK